MAHMGENQGKFLRNGIFLCHDFVLGEMVWYCHDTLMENEVFIVLRILTVSCIGICLLALSGCGGSSGSADQTVVSNPVVTGPVDSVQPVSVGDSGAEAVVAVQTDTDMETEILPGSDSSVNESTLVLNESDQVVNSDQTTSVETSTDTADELTVTEDALVSEDTLVATPDASANRFCEPVTASVTYEPYCHVSSDCIIEDGRHVPVPAAGFGWDGSQVCDLSASFGVDAIEVLVPFVRQNADIDGISENNWRNAAIAGTSNNVVSRNDIDNLMLSPVPGYLDGAGYSTWSAMHDGTNLYIRVRVSSDFSNTPFIDSPGQPWFDDSVEIFIDGNNSKGSEYDGIDDFQAILLAHPSADWQPIISPSSAPGLGIFYRTSENSFRLFYEIAINLESAGIIPGQPFGFDVHINEDDNGGERDAKWGWFEQSGFDRSYLQPDVFGTLVLTECDDPVTCGSHQILSR